MTPLGVVLDTNMVVMPIARGTKSNDSWIIGVWQGWRDQPFDQRSY